MIETWRDGLCRHGNPMYPKLRKDYCKWCLLNMRWYNFKERWKEHLKRFHLRPRWWMFSNELDFLDNQTEIRNLSATREWLCRNGFEITQFTREKSEQNPRYHNYFLTARRFGRMQPDYKSLREFEREYWNQ